jgi:hypothetical protein
MIKTDELKGYLAKNGFTGARFAREKLKITPDTFFNKMKKGVFGSDEIQIMVDELRIDDPVGIFFAKSVTQ